MKVKVTIVLLSIVTASLLVSGGYGYWQEELTIEGTIKVVKPAPISSNQLLVQPVPIDPNIQPVDNTVGQLPAARESLVEEQVEKGEIAVPIEEEAPIEPKILPEQLEMPSESVDVDNINAPLGTVGDGT